MSFIWENFVLAIIAFGILYFLLNRYAFGPLFSVMEKRADMVRNQVQSAETNRQQAEQLLAEQKEAIQAARKEAFDMIEIAKATSSRQANDIISQAKNEANRLKEEAMNDIESEKNRAILALRNEVSAMSVLIASKIIEKQIDEKSQQQLVEHYLKEVGGKQ